MKKISDIESEYILSEKIKDGLKINYMVMRSDGKDMWKESWADKNIWDSNSKINIKVPKKILKCKFVSREMNFSSVEKIDNLKMIQRVTFHGECIEKWNFEFGFIMPKTTNSWEMIIEASKNMLKAEDLSGNIEIETTFYAGKLYIGKNIAKVFYV